MSKAIFRFLRGELNGFYLTALHNTLNVFTEDTKQFFIDFSKQQVAKGEISNETLYNLGKFASIFLPRRPVAESKTSIYMTESKIVDGEEYSERGLYNIDNETFDFKHTGEGTYPDINTLATETERSSLVGTETVQGYIPEDAENVLDDDGNVRPEKLLTTPPEDKAYSDFYGDKFLYLSEGTVTYENISPSLFLDLLKAVQWVRYNGVSLISLVKVIEAVCPDGLVQIKEIRYRSPVSLYVVYKYNPEVTSVDNKEQRFSLFEYIINLKFKQIVLLEDTEE